MLRILGNLLLCCLICAAANGCTHTQLRWNTVNQSRTLTDLFEQQVLDNLAMFVADPNSTPFFSYPNIGGSNVQDAANGSSLTAWDPFGFTSQALSLGASRNWTESWTLTPVYDVRRLELMRCAYQQALLCAGVYPEIQTCQDCEKLLLRFYTGSERPSERLAERLEGEGVDPLVDFTEKTGRTTPACLSHVRWFEFGDRKRMPRRSKYNKSGSYCDTCVWLCDGGQEELSKLTLIILDFAYSPQAMPKPQTTANFTWTVDACGKPVPSAQATLTIQATLPISKPTDRQEMHKMNAHAIEAAPPVDDYTIPPILSPGVPSFIQFDLNRQFITPQQLPATVP
jgi:hypothetical protein